MKVMSKIFLVALCVPLSAILSAEVLSAPERSMPSPNLGGTITSWSRGYLIQLANENEDGSIRVYSTNGDVFQLASQTRVWPEGTQAITLIDAAASPSGAVFAATGHTTATNGASSSFIAFFGPGRTQLLVQLPNSGIYKVAFAGDGTLWVLARQFDSAFQELGDYNALRHYNTDGKFLGAAIPRSGFAGTLSATSPPMSHPSLTISPDTVGVYLDKAETWVELAYDGSVKGQWSVPKNALTPGQRQVTDELLLTGSGQIIRETALNGKQPADRTRKIDHLRKSGSTLVPTSVDASAYVSAHPFFLGIDGDQVVWLEDSTKLNCSSIQY